MLEIKNTEIKGSWREVADSARTTVGLDVGTKEPSSKWKKQILLAEHSPIRQLQFKWKWTNLPYWVSVHIVRHWLGILHFVKTSRSDRTGIQRDKLPQDNPVDHECIANAQALINISRKRLCNKASPETKEAWELVIASLNDKDSILASVCVPECIYRGFCPEFKSCGYVNTLKYLNELEKYRKNEKENFD
jgi:hypothetical protein